MSVASRKARNLPRASCAPALRDAPEAEARPRKDAEARIFGCHLVGNSRRAVSRAIVDHQHFKPLETLRLQTLQTLPEVGLGVARDDDHTQQRCECRLVSRGWFRRGLPQLPQRRLDRSWEAVGKAPGQGVESLLPVVHRSLVGVRYERVSIRRSLRTARRANGDFLAGPSDFGWARSLGCLIRPTSRDSPEVRRVK